MGKKLIALMLFVVLLIPNIALAKEDYATVVWEGLVSNNYYHGHIMKVRITIDGVVGDQVSDGKAEVYKDVYKGDRYGSTHYILPIVDGGSIKIEYISTEEDKTFQDSEGIIAGTGCYTLEDIYKIGLMVKEDHISSEKFYANKEFKFNVTQDSPIQLTDLKLSSLEKQSLVAYTYMSPPVDPRAYLLIQVVSKSQAQKMMKEIKDGHDTYNYGKTFDDPTNEDKFDMKFLPVSQSALESKYGFSISVEDGFYPKVALLGKLDRIFSRFPDGLIKEITSYYKSKGISSKIKFQYKETNYGGAFSDKGSNTLYYYVSPFAQFDDWTIAHEMGHYVHKYLNDKYGYSKLKSEWTSLNDGYGYNKSEWSDNHRNYFVRDYSLTNYSEDFATIFELIAGNDPQHFRTDLLENSDTVLKKKVDLLNSILVQKSKSVSNAKKLWGRSIPQVPSSYSATTCEKAKEAGIIPDTEQFAGLYTAKITREDFCILIKTLIEKESNMTITEFAKSKGIDIEWYNYSSLSTGGESRTRSNYPYCDIDNKDIFNLNALGIVSSVAEKIFNPEGLITREQAACIITTTARVLGKDMTSASVSFLDSDKISSWAKSSIDYVSSNGLMGRGDTFLPKDNITYEQVYIILYNFFTKLK